MTTALFTGLGLTSATFSNLNNTSFSLNTAYNKVTYTFTAPVNLTLLSFTIRASGGINNGGYVVAQMWGPNGTYWGNTAGYMDASAKTFNLIPNNFVMQAGETTYLDWSTMETWRYLNYYQDSTGRLDISFTYAPYYSVSSGTPIPSTSISMYLLNQTFNLGYSLASYRSIGGSVPATGAMAFGHFVGRQPLVVKGVYTTSVAIPAYSFSGQYGAWVGRSWGNVVVNVPGLSKVVSTQIVFNFQKTSGGAVMYFWVNATNLTRNAGFAWAGYLQDYTGATNFTGFQGGVTATTAASPINFQNGDTIQFGAGNYSSLTGNVSGTLYIAYTK